MRNILTICFLLSGQMLFSQCFPDRHNTTWYDSWISCTPSANPNAVRGESHWLMYNLGHDYLLKESKFWNANQPDFLQDGLKDVVIDYSLDGIIWQEWGVFTIPQGSGQNHYEGIEGPDFSTAPVAARYVLITAIDNYGGGCYSLSELKINVEEVDIVLALEEEEVDESEEETKFAIAMSIQPNPVQETAKLRFSLNDFQEANISLHTISGQSVRQIANNEWFVEGENEISFSVNGLTKGIYFVKLKCPKFTAVRKLIVN